MPAIFLESFPPVAFWNTLISSQVDVLWLLRSKLPSSFPGHGSFRPLFAVKEPFNRQLFEGAKKRPKLKPFKLMFWTAGPNEWKVKGFRMSRDVVCRNWCYTSRFARFIQGFMDVRALQKYWDCCFRVGWATDRVLMQISVFHRMKTLDIIGNSLDSPFSTFMPCHGSQVIFHDSQFHCNLWNE